ncbi:hypothetical protein AVEN_250331-1 [Araneus ventricosus]|uniref:Uncharacterized protein n=1 Tax=Araneus ventricosus TaxID=182803 RepID=A0A4Y2UQ77_ARAVE|nr:hypothetical protein AVEN_250331-1 [Araneus ventricosus]
MTSDIYECPICSHCTFEKPKKIPGFEQRFIYFPGKYGLGKIDSLDTKETTKLKTRIKRKSYTSKREICKPILAVTNEPDTLNEIQASCSANVDIDDECKTTYFLKKSSWQIRIAKSKTLNSIFYRVSDQAAAAIESSVFQEIGLITKTDTSEFVERYKI